MKAKIEHEAIKYCNSLDFSGDTGLSEKGRTRVREWSKQDFIAGANYIVKQLKEFDLGRRALALLLIDLPANSEKELEK